MNTMEKSTWKQVPVEPTEAMLTAGFNVPDNQDYGAPRPDDIYSAMIKAAPERPDASVAAEEPQAATWVAAGTVTVVPKGWRLMPLEPTPEILEAVWSLNASNGGDSTRVCYRAMLAAAPWPPAPAAGGVREAAMVIPSFDRTPEASLWDDILHAYQYIPRSKMFPADCFKERIRALMNADERSNADEVEASQAADALEPALPIAEAAGGADWGAQATQLAEAILLQLGRSVEASREPGADWRRDCLCRLIEPYLAAAPSSSIRVATTDLAALTRPIIGIENRTPCEVFDIMVDRIRRGVADAPPPPRTDARDR